MRFISTWKVGIWLLVLLSGLVFPAVAQPEVPALTGRVVDLADILSSSAEASLTSLLEAHEDSTSNQVAVLTIPSLEGETIEAYALRVAETWALGTAEADNGVLLLVALSDREMRIEVGMGLEGDLTDAAAGRIIRNEMVPYFRSGDYEEGVLVGVERVLGTINGSYVPSDDPFGEEPPLMFGLMFLLIPSFFAFMGVFTPGCMRWFLFLFLVPFFFVGGTALTGAWLGGGIVLGLYAVLYIGSSFHPTVQAVQKGIKTKVGPFTMGGSSGGWSSSGGGWSSGGGGFSGGGGSFGGGGASGGW